MRKIGLFGHGFSKNVSVGQGDKGEISCSGTQLSLPLPPAWLPDVGLLVEGSQGSRSGFLDLGPTDTLDQVFFVVGAVLCTIDV